MASGRRCSMSDLRFTVNTCQASQLLAHLSRCSDHYYPPLAARVDLGQYSERLTQRATRFEAWDGDELVGLVAAYLNPATRDCFITNVSVVPTHFRQGLAAKLLQTCLKAAEALGLETASLEVSDRTEPAMQLYRRAGFETSARTGDQLLMRRCLGPQPLQPPPPADPEA